MIVDTYRCEVLQNYGKGLAQSCIALFNIHLLHIQNSLGLEKRDLGSFWDSSIVERQEMYWQCSMPEGYLRARLEVRNTLQKPNTLYRHSSIVEVMFPIINRSKKLFTACKIFVVVALLVEQA